MVEQRPNVQLTSRETCPAWSLQFIINWTVDGVVDEFRTKPPSLLPPLKTTSCLMESLNVCPVDTVTDWLKRTIAYTLILVEKNSLAHGKQHSGALECITSCLKFPSESVKAQGEWFQRLDASCSNGFQGRLH